MGEVYLVEREGLDFSHRACIKVIRRGAVPEALQERFLIERQLLARLDHPSIAQLFDAGETEDGLPYFVMEYVEGQRLDQWLENENPEVGLRLDVFALILDAVGEAHRNLIVHRDLTPGNVLVRGDGAVKLIDFGISKLALETGEVVALPDDQSTEARTGTPGYAAPEREGREGANTLIDVFSLGRLLDLMMPSGKRDAELEAIIASASAEDPHARYPAVEVFQADLEAYRAGLPVNAFNGGRTYAARKFASRHWPFVTATLAVFTMLVAALAWAAVSQTRAERAQTEAEQRFADVRTLSNTMMFDVYDALAEVPGSISARALLARSSINYLESLASSPGAPRDVRLEVGEGWLRVSQVTGGSSGGSLGLAEDASEFADRALTVLEALHSEQPDDDVARVALGRALAILALDSLYSEGDSDTGFARATRTVALLEQAPPADVRAAAALANADRALGDAHGWRDELEKAGEVYARGLQAISAMPVALRESSEVRTVQPPLVRQLGDVYRYTGQPERALELMREAVALNEALANEAAPPDRSRTRRNLVIALWNLADMNRSLGRWEEGLVQGERGLAISRDEADRNPDDSGWTVMISLTQRALAGLYSGNEAHASAVRSADEVISALRHLRRISGANMGADLALAVGWKDVAPAYRAAEQSATACSGLAEAHALLAGYEASGELSEYDRANNLEPVAEMLESC
ncbi:serine/threonine-protein kinase [Aurantiacibacter zhengii]|nr:serine/threonine-protein kinase [Aurantiacibacter zhengii]